MFAYFSLDRFRKHNGDVKDEVMMAWQEEFYFRLSLERRLRLFQDATQVVFTSTSERQRSMLVVKSVCEQASQKSFYFVAHALFNNSS